MSDVTAIDAMISIHALREEGDVTASAMSFRTWYFYPRPPRGGRPAALRPATPEHWISIHALREEGDEISYDDELEIEISIHALREEGDFVSVSLFGTVSGISIHALREEGDPAVQ